MPAHHTGTSSNPGPAVKKTFFMLNSAQHEIYHAHTLKSISKKMIDFDDLNLKIALILAFIYL